MPETRSMQHNRQRLQFHSLNTKSIIPPIPEPPEMPGIRDESKISYSSPLFRMEYSQPIWDLEEEIRHHELRPVHSQDAGVLVELSTGQDEGEIARRGVFLVEDSSNGRALLFESGKCCIPVIEDILEYGEADL